MSQFPEFIILSEFCQKDGAQPIFLFPQHIEQELHRHNVPTIVPTVVSRVMSIETKNQSDLVSSDSQLLVDFDNQEISCFVHHFSLSDIEARGYTRTCALIYVSSDLQKCLLCKDELSYSFQCISDALKASNSIQFMYDLTFRLHSMRHTQTRVSDKLERLRRGEDISDDVENVMPQRKPAAPPKKSSFSFTVRIDPLKKLDMLESELDASMELLYRLLEVHLKRLASVYVSNPLNVFGEYETRSGYYHSGIIPDPKHLLGLWTEHNIDYKALFTLPSNSMRDVLRNSVPKTDTVHTLSIFDDDITLVDTDGSLDSDYDKHTLDHVVSPIGGLLGSRAPEPGRLLEFTMEMDPTGFSLENEEKIHSIFGQFTIERFVPFYLDTITKNNSEKLETIDKITQLTFDVVQTVLYRLLNVVSRPLDVNFFERVEGIDNLSNSTVEWYGVVAEYKQKRTRHHFNFTENITLENAELQKPWSHSVTKEDKCFLIFARFVALHVPDIIVRNRDIEVLPTDRLRSPSDLSTLSLISSSSNFSLPTKHFISSPLQRTRSDLHVDKKSTWYNQEFTYYSFTELFSDTPTYSVMDYLNVSESNTGRSMPAFDEDESCSMNLTMHEELITDIFAPDLCLEAYKASIPSLIELFDRLGAENFISAIYTILCGEILVIIEQDISILRSFVTALSFFIPTSNYIDLNTRIILGHNAFGLKDKDLANISLIGLQSSTNCGFLGDVYMLDFHENSFKLKNYTSGILLDLLSFFEISFRSTAKDLLVSLIQKVLFELSNKTCTLLGRNFDRNKNVRAVIEEDINETFLSSNDLEIVKYLSCIMTYPRLKNFKTVLEYGISSPIVLKLDLDDIDEEASET
ncbi:hypothetical protein PCE1_000368 [Barthelona sp. PCE]